MRTRALAIGILAATLLSSAAPAQQLREIDAEVKYIIADRVNNLCFLVISRSSRDFQMPGGYLLVNGTYYGITGTTPCTDDMKRQAIAVAVKLP